jgi:ABC-type polysaccharide/polyol phosphate transport system ATPase subunit
VDKEIAIRIQGLGRYFGVPLQMNGAVRPRESWHALMRIAGINLTLPAKPDGYKTVAPAGHVLRDISLDIERGSVTCLTGPSGSGKTVLLKILAGAMLPTAGRIQIHGTVASILENGDNINNRLTAHENILQSQTYRALTTEQGQRFAADVIDFAELEGFEHVPLRTYSTGMLMRLNVALTLCGPASIFLLDDVLAVGDIAFQQKVVDRLRALAAEGRTLVIALSEEALVQQLATRVVTLGHGHVVSDLPPRRLMANVLSTKSTEFECHVTRDLPEDELMALQTVAVERYDAPEGTYLDLTLGFEAKIGGVRCRPSVFLMQRKKIIMRSLCPEYIALPAPGRFVCVVRLPVDLLANGAYAITPDIHTFTDNEVYALKARDAVTLTVRRPTATAPEKRPPLLHVAFPWEVEALALESA